MTQAAEPHGTNTVNNSYPNLDRITFTGADDSVKASEILALAAKYPKTEWGILFGGGQEGAARFPSSKWIVNELPKLEGLNLCAHLCGRWVNDLVIHGDFTWLYVYDEFAKLFKRAQINFHGLPYTMAKSFPFRIESEPFEFIFQSDGVNDWIRDLAIANGVKNLTKLYDVSHGAGVLPDDGWPKRTKKEWLGYAGGLGPLNIKVQLEKIDKAAGDHGPYWIDMETKVRSSADQVFDLGKCETVCRAIWGVQ